MGHRPTVMPKVPGECGRGRLGIMEWMKSLQLLLFLTPVACLLAQTPPPPKPTVTLSTETPHATAAPPAKVPPETVVLTVGEEKITAADLDHLIDMIPEQVRNQARTTGRRQFGDNVVRLKIMVQEARRRKLEDTQAFKDQLAFQGENLLAQMLYQNILATAKPDDATTRAYYDEHKSDYVEVKARHILIRFKGSPVPLRAGEKELTEEEALAKAQDIRKKLADGGDFDALAKAESDDVGSGSKGGDLGTFGHGRMVPAFETVAFSLPVGQLSDPVKSQFGYHIIKVETRQEKTYPEVRADIEKKLQPEMAKKEVEALRTATPVVMDPNYFGPPAPPPAPASLGPGRTPVQPPPPAPAPQPK
jgi:peptidyl-prolyl cis-trans isomerase C